MEIGRRDKEAGPEPSPDDPSTDPPPQQKRKHHRRARKGRRKHQADEVPEEQPDAADQPSPSLSRTSRKRNHHQVYLRPTNGPLLNAPRNSTQFIIDDHENSNLFYNFGGNNGHGEPGALGAAEAVDVEADVPAAAGEQENVSPDDDTFWAEYSERDFQSVYETAHQEEIAEWDRKKLCDEISALERRQKELVNILARLDPEIYLQKLQSELLSLQEVNRVLKEEHSELNPALPDSSTAEDPASLASVESIQEEAGQNVAMD